MLLPRSVIFAPILALACTSPWVPQPPSGSHADIVFRNARVITMDPDNPFAEELAIAGDRIVGLGRAGDLDPLVGRTTEVHDLGGRTIIPGINETHIHVRDLGFEQNQAVNLEPARSVADVQHLLRNRLAELQRADRLDGWHYPTTGETGEWLFGLGWTQDRLVEHRMTTRQELDAVSRDIPISLDRIYRGISVNTAVFELLGIDFDDPSTHPEWFTRDPEDFAAGDIIFRDPDTGLPTGVFVGTVAPRLVAAAIPTKTLEQKVDSLVLGLEVLASYGITSIVEAGSSMGSVTRVYQQAHDRGDLPVRVTIYDGWYRGGDPGGLGDPGEIAERLSALGFHNIGDNTLRIRGAKSSADGGVGSRSAAMSVPFLPIPEDPLGDSNYGSYRDADFDHRLAQFEVLADHGWEIHTHATGDAAIRQTMDVYKHLLDEIAREDPQRDVRWSIIHNYLPDEPGTSVIADMAEYKIIAAVNPANLYFEGDSFVRNIGPERMSRHTPFKTFLDAGILMASGSDYPNNSPDPWIGMYAMCTRRHQISGEVYGPEQCIPFLEALKTFTINGAHLTYDNDVRGSLELGKLADLVIVDANLAEIAHDDLLSMGSKVLLTMLGGRVTYQSPGFDLWR